MTDKPRLISMSKDEQIRYLESRMNRPHDGREESKWCFAPISEKQATFLQRHGYSADQVGRIDRGSAYILINLIIREEQFAHSYDVPGMPRSPNDDR